jgi:hypothetical protein
LKRGKAGEARLLPELTTAEETLEGLIEAVGERLHRALSIVLAAASLEAVRQLVAAEERARSLVMSLDRFEHPVVQTAALGKTGKEQSVLVAVGESL